MRFDKILKPQNIIPRLQADDKEGIIRELVSLLARNGCVKDEEKAVEDVLAREKRMSTGLEYGLAIPHAKTETVSDLCMAMGLKPEGVDFHSLDHKPAKVIFLVFSPLGVSGPHIQCLAEIAKHYSKSQIRDSLPQAGTAEEILAKFT